MTRRRRLYRDQSRRSSPILPTHQLGRLVWPSGMIRGRRDRRNRTTSTPRCTSPARRGNVCSTGATRRWCASGPQWRSPHSRQGGHQIYTAIGGVVPLNEIQQSISALHIPNDLLSRQSIGSPHSNWRYSGRVLRIIPPYLTLKAFPQEPSPANWSLEKEPILGTTRPSGVLILQIIAKDCPGLPGNLRIASA